MVYLPLFLMFLIGILSVSFVFGTLSDSSQVFTGSDDAYGGSTSFDNGTETKKFDTVSVVLATGEAGSLVAIVTAGIAMFLALGLNVLGTGLNSVGTKAVGSLILFGLLWAAVSAFSVIPLTGGSIGLGENIVVVEGIPLLGWLCYLVLTFVYMLGVYEVALK